MFQTRTEYQSSGYLQFPEALAFWNSSEKSNINSPMNSTLTYSRFGVGSCHFHQFLEVSLGNGVGGDLFHLLHLLLIATSPPPSGDT